MQDVEYAEEFEIDSPFSEVEELEYAANLLEITNEAELDQFLGSLLSKVSQAVGGVLQSPARRALGGYLKGAIGQALPGVGAAVGGYFVPGGGAAAGRRLAATAGQMFGLELEGLSAEDQEFEIARRLIRWAGTAARCAARLAPGVDVQSAVLAATRKHAPGLLRAGTSLAGLFEETDYAREVPASEAESPFGEVEVMELASELLEVTDESELDRFIGDLLKKASRAAGVLLKTPIGQHVGGLVKGAIKHALPSLGAAIGGYLAPGAGAAVGRALATRGGQMLGMEAEEMAGEDHEFDVARRLVRFAGSAAKRAAARQGAASPPTVARVAVAQAARRHLPSLLHSPAAAAAGTNVFVSCGCRSSRSGRWVQRGSKIIVMDL